MKYFSMFSGIGGFELGLQNSKHNFECVGFCEVDKYAISIYTRHFPNHHNFGDATKLRTETIPDFEFLVGGFPCQAFSISGDREGFNDTRGTLFFEIARILKDKRPKYFLLENVTGLLSHNQGHTFKTIIGILSELGYNVFWKVYNSKNYGVPQNRERVFIEGYFRTKCGRKILSVPRKSTETTGINLIQVNNHKKTSQSTRVYDSNGLSITVNAAGVNGFYLLNGTKDGNVCTIDCNYYKGVSPSDVKKNRMKRTHIFNFNDNKIRKLTPIECERLQGFPDNWTKYGKDDKLISDTQRYKCCGNAVTTNVITAIVDEMFDKVKK